MNIFYYHYGYRYHYGSRFEVSITDKLLFIRYFKYLVFAMV